MNDMVLTGVEWCPEIPDDWTINRVKNCFYISKQQAGIENPTVLKLARDGVKVRDISNNEGQLAESYDNYNPVKPGDLLLNPMDLYSGANCNMSEIEGVISPAYVNLRKKVDLNPKFFDYYFKVQYWTMAMFAHGKGVSFDNRWTINAEGVKNYEIPFPSIEEQNKIVDFIEKNITKIDALIANQQQQIEKLKQYKQSLITEVVTKGLDKNVPMKDSGVESIGRIPSAWKLLRTKFVASSLQKGNGITKDEVFIDGDIQCIRYGEIYTKYNQSFSKTVSKTKLSILSKPQHIEYGDILFAGTGELVEEIGKNIVYLGDNPCVAGGDIIVMKHNEEPRFMNYALNADCSQKQKSKGKAKLKVVHISATAIGDVMVALPDKDTQIIIANYLDEKCRIIDKLLDEKEIKIDKLNQYKKSLIYEYVTGKKRVPEA